MKILNLIIIILLIVLAFVFGFLFNNFITNGNLTGKVIQEDKYSWTKAICNQNNECVDVLIYCENSNVAKIEPSSDYIVKHSENWTDPRNDSEKLC